MLAPLLLIYRENAAGWVQAASKKLLKEVRFDERSSEWSGVPVRNFQSAAVAAWGNDRARARAGDGDRRRAGAGRRRAGTGRLRGGLERQLDAEQRYLGLVGRWLQRGRQQVLHA